MTDTSSLVTVLSCLPDPRVERSREHELTDLLVIAVCTLLVGGESFYDMENFGHARKEWLQTFLRLEGGIPSHDTFNRLFQAPDPAAFAETFAQWTQGLRQSLDRENTAAAADYVLALKSNQGTVLEEVRAYLDDALARQAPELATHTTVDRGHGRRETRRYWQSGAIGWFADRAAWPGLRSVGVVEATLEAGGKTTVERRYYLSSLPVDAVTFARALRGHWAVETQYYWVRDVVFGEDQSRARTGHAVANLGLLRRLALNLLRRDTSCKRGAKGKQHNDALKPDYLLRLLNAAPSV